MSSVMMRTPKLTACCRISAINSGPLTPCFRCGAISGAARRQGRCRNSRQVAGGEAGIVLYFGGQVQLAQGKGAGQAVFFAEGPFEDQRLQCRPGGIDGGGPGGGAAADDDDFSPTGYPLSRGSVPIFVRENGAVPFASSPIIGCWRSCAYYCAIAKNRVRE